MNCYDSKNLQSLKLKRRIKGDITAGDPVVTHGTEVNESQFIPCSNNYINLNARGCSLADYTGGLDPNPSMEPLSHALG